MPFTFSHPAAVLPFKYIPAKWLSLTGLVIGSMTPDFEYFIRMRVYSSYSHTWIGMFWFDLPLTLLSAFVFHCIVRDTLIDNLPRFLKKRFLLFKQFQWTFYIKKNFIGVIISCLIGIITHFLWDGFTHENGQFVQILDFLQETTNVGKHDIPVYKILQHSSSILGGIIMIYTILQLPPNGASHKENNLFYWLSIALIAIIVVGIRFLSAPDAILVGNLITTTISGFFIGLILLPIFYRRKVNGMY
jgi:hypothetical protein